jgi:hypothetical protein
MPSGPVTFAPGVRLEVFTVIWMIIEAVLALGAGAGEIGVAGVGEEPAAAERHRPHRERRDARAGAAELPVFHGSILSR